MKVQCPECKKAELQHLHSAAHGIEGTHMAGSERYECPECGNAMFKDGESEELIFFFD